MKKSLTLFIVAALALGIGFAYATPMLIVPMDVEFYPRVPVGPKADFTVDVVYANFDTAKFQFDSPVYNEEGQLNHTETYPAINVTYNVVLNVTNTAYTPATLYEVSFAAAQNISVQQSILGGSIYDYGYTPNNPFGAIVDGVYLDGKWVNVTWIPQVQYEDNGTMVTVPYPECLISLTQARWLNGIISGPLSPDEVEAFSVDHTLNGTIPELPENASSTGTWFEGVPIAEYYNQTGTPLVTEMYVNGVWVDVTDRVMVSNTQPMITATNMLVNEVSTVGAQPYQNMNSTVGPVTALPTWGDWGSGKAFFTFPWNWANQHFNNTFAPHESKLIAFNHTQFFILNPEDAPPTKGIEALQTGNITIYASASNYLNNTPINGTYQNTVSTANQITELHLEKTQNGYLYNKILAGNQTFQPINNLEVTIAPRNTP